MGWGLPPYRYDTALEIEFADPCRASGRDDPDEVFPPRSLARHEPGRSREMSRSPLLLLLLWQGLATRAPAQQPGTAFDHSRHQSLACLDCHSTSRGGHGRPKITAPDGCLGCHHGPSQRATCAACHGAGPSAPRPVPVTFRLSVRREVITRPVGFPHPRHAGLECARCHANDITRTVAPASCNACHADHHTPARDCSGCHPTARAGHDRAVHDGCAGCHTDQRVAALASSRSLCLSCHQKQRDHNPGGDCAACHAVVLHPGAKAGRPQ
jgi:hypothetical protein